MCCWFLDSVTPLLLIQRQAVAFLDSASSENEIGAKWQSHFGKGRKKNICHYRDSVAIIKLPQTR